MPRWLYSLLLRLALPGAVLWFLWRHWSHRAGLRDLLAAGIMIRTGTERGGRPVWLHAASVGEVQALAPVVRGLAKSGYSMALTVGTPTGLARARELYAYLQAGEQTQLTLQLAPWDLPGAARRFLQATQPRAAVFIETELWPNRIAACEHAGVPLLLVSARLTGRSLVRYQRFASGMMRKAVRAFAGIAAQTPADQARFIALGAAADRVTVAGNLKFDLAMPGDVAARGQELRQKFAAGRPLWVAGSTHPGEETGCVEAQRILSDRARRAGQAVPVLLLAPRRPERFDDAASWLAGTGLRTARVSHMPPDADAEVLLLDTLGELLHWYAAADVAFVGGSLVPVGGHNLLEPAALGKPVLSGPHCFNSPESATLLAAADALVTVNGAAQLAQAVARLLGDIPAAQAMGVRAAAVVTANRGAAAQAIGAIAAIAPQAQPSAGC